MGAASSQEAGRQQQGPVADLGSGSAGGPDMSPFSPKLFVGSRPLWNWMASAASIAAARPQSGPQLCVLGGAEAMLREAQLS